MDDALQKLLDAALTGDDIAVNKLGRALRSRCQKTPSLLEEFSNSEEPTMRRAAIIALAGGEDEQSISRIEELAQDSDPDVRRQLALSMTEKSTWPVEHLCEALLADDSVDVRRDAIGAAQRHPSMTDALVRRLRDETEHWLRENVARALADGNPSVALPALIDVVVGDEDFNVRAVSADSLERIIAKTKGFPADVERPKVEALVSLRQFLDEDSYGGYSKLKKWLKAELETNVDVKLLRSFGTLLSTEAREGRLPRAHYVDDVVSSLITILQGKPPRAAVLLGDSGVGKSAVIYELVHRLASDVEKPWMTLSMSPSDFLTGTKFLGEWETKVQSIVDAISSPKPVLLFVSSIEDLLWVGTTDKSDSNVASALAPFIERGEITIIGESTTESFRKALSTNRHLASLFHQIELPQADAERTRAIARAVIDETNVEVEPDVVERLSELGELFGGVSVEPGRSVGLLRRVIGSQKAHSESITTTKVLETISTSTGIPLDFLDDTVALEGSELRSFFETRVMGQSEAVSAVVDLVTLIKAGLTDPGRPLGVLLFVGPTGVGKTELARALAERLFGDPANLVRLDMSEYATYEAFERLIGSSWKGAEPGILTSAMREKPFSVVLFDEIEKAHPNIYNLCLQIFDAARLTDSHGRVASFRQSIIILTSNVGSKEPGEGIVGFGRGDEAQAPELHLKELERWFRPEFLNRLDRISVFRALTVETAEKIARREVARVLERSGIARRRLAIDIEPDVYPLILKEGYSPTFGARPLKRTVERMVLLPVAKVIAAGRAPRSALLRLVVRGEHLAIEVESPEQSSSARPTLSPRVDSLAQRLQSLREQSGQLGERADRLSERKSELLIRSTSPGFWDDQGRSRALMDEIYRLDGVLEALSQLDQKIQIRREQLDARRENRAAVLELDRRVEALENELAHVSFLVNCQDMRELGDALVTITLSTSQGDELGATVLIARMYQRLATRRGLESEVLSERVECDPPDDSVSLMVSGPGAYALLVGENGLHQVSRRREPEVKEASERREAQKKTVRLVDRAMVRVEVLPAPRADDELSLRGVRTEHRALRNEQGRLLPKLKQEVHLFHEPSLTSVMIRTDASKRVALSHARLLLRARLDSPSQPHDEGTKVAIIRRYQLGPTTLVKDQRTGKQTGRLDRVLDGDLDMFLKPYRIRRS